MNYVCKWEITHKMNFESYNATPPKKYTHLQKSRAPKNGFNFVLQYLFKAYVGY